ncbi:hypothetical protein D3C75_915750 [compost metagenome]
MSVLSFLIDSVPSSVISVPSNNTLPDVGSINLSTVLPSVVFPEPDSPTIAKVSPFSIAKDTPSSDFAAPVTRPNRPVFTG